VLAGDKRRELCIKHFPHKKRAQGKPGARCTRSLACGLKKHTSAVTTGSPEIPGLPCAMVLTVSFALSSVTGLSCHRRMRNTFRTLDASVGASGPHDFAVRGSAARQRVATCVHCIPHPTFVTTRTPLLSRRDGASRKFDLPDGESEIFFAKGLDNQNSQIAKLPVGQITSTSKSSLPAIFDETHPQFPQLSVSVYRFGAGLPVVQGAHAGVFNPVHITVNLIEATNRSPHLRCIDATTQSATFRGQKWR
jgi:hypothetical protein